MTTFVLHEVRYFTDDGQCVRRRTQSAPLADTAIAAFALVRGNAPKHWPASWAAGKLALPGEAVARWHVAPHPEGFAVVDQTQSDRAYIAAEGPPNSWTFHPATARAVSLASDASAVRH
jgi:hypothetical protein